MNSTIEPKKTANTSIPNLSLICGNFTKKHVIGFEDKK